ncbi:MAG: type II secretion system protein GspC [Myxococcota bacterium]
MEKLSKYYPQMINVALLIMLSSGSATVSADAASWFLFKEPEYQVAPQTVEPVKPARIKSKNINSEKKIKAVLSRNMFCSDCPPISLEDLAAPEGGEEKIEEKELASLKNASLILTMVFDNPEDSLAFIAFKENEIEKEEELEALKKVQIGDIVAKASVIEIENKRVKFLKDGKEKVLTLFGETEIKTVEKEKKDTKKKGGKKSALQKMKDSIKKIGPYKYEIDKDVVKNLMKNIAKAGRGARIVPHSKGGFRASFVRHYSLFYKLGVRSGDIIKSVNNIPLNSIQETMMLYTKLKNASHLTISLKRRGKPVNIDYNIR